MRAGVSVTGNLTTGASANDSSILLSITVSDVTVELAHTVGSTVVHGMVLTRIDWEISLASSTMPMLLMETGTIGPHVTGGAGA